MTFAEIEKSVVKWGEQRDLYKRSKPLHQHRKLTEESDELYIALSTGDRTLSIDAIGDMMVVLTGIAKMLNTDLTNCYLTAYNEIKDRKGSMINGEFVKERS